MARPRKVENLDCDAPFALAAAQAVEVRAAEVLEHSRGVLDTRDIERVHAMRVATRRLRAALEIFKPCFPRSSYKAVLKEVKALADALGERRDSDVAIEMLEVVGRDVGAQEARGIDILVEVLREEQWEANDELEPFVEHGRLAALAARLEDLAAAARGSRKAGPEVPA
jgi:CHAD domain-containing protein